MYYKKKFYIFNVTESILILSGADFENIYYSFYDSKFFEQLDENYEMFIIYNQDYTNFSDATWFETKIVTNHI